MHVLKKAFIFSFIGILFIGTVGVRVFEHVCSINGTDRHLFVEESDNCSIKETTKSCCLTAKKDISINADTQRVTKKPCCETQDYFYKIQENISENQTSSVQTTSNNAVLFASNSHFFSSENFFYRTITKPPVQKVPFTISTKEFLQFTQVYRV